MKILIVGGSSVDYDQLKSCLLESDFVIALDRGLDHLEKIHQQPDLLLGDMDSVSARIRDQYPSEYYPSEKNFSDLEAGFSVARAKGYSRLQVLGATGGRLDHFLSALALLIDMPGQVELLDARNRIRRLPEQLDLAKGEYKYFSIQALCPCVVSIRGAKYPLTKQELLPQESLCLSNEWKEAAAQIILHSGLALLIESRD